MKRILSALAALAASLAPAVSFAQDAVADAADTFATIYLIGGGVAVFAIGALITWGVGKLTGSSLQVAAGRFLTVFNAGLEGSHAVFKRDLARARHADSPGGAVITDGEWERIGSSQWVYLISQYGSFDGIAKVVRQITGAKGDDAVRGFIDAKTNAGIAELERADKAAAARDPSTP